MEKKREQVKYSDDGKELLYIPSDFEGALVIPEGVEDTGLTVFYDVPGITSISFPGSMKRIDTAVIAKLGECGDIREIRVGDKVFTGDWTEDTVMALLKDPECAKLCNCDIKEISRWLEMVEESVEYYGDSRGMRALSYVPSLYRGEFVVPDDVSEIHPYAFAHCDRITSIVIPDSVISIGDEGKDCSFVFKDCTRLSEIYYGDKVFTGPDAVKDFMTEFDVRSKVNEVMREDKTSDNLETIDKVKELSLDD